MTISVETERLWQAYLRADHVGLRNVSIPALHAFLDGLDTEPGDVAATWASDLARRVADDGDKLKIRTPLFQRAVLPALVEGIARSQPGCARWLAHFESLMRRWPGMLPESLRSSTALLQEALRVDPDDDRARAKLIGRNASWMRYSLHELPHGVLYGPDAASVDECRHMVAGLADFGRDVDRLGVREQYAELIAACELHYSAYIDYLLSGRPEGSYAAYLRARGVDPEPPRSRLR